MTKMVNSKVCLLFILLSLNSCRTAPVYNAVDIPISPRASATDEEISEAIWFAGRRRGWRITKVRPGEMHGEFSKRAHRATVRILYDQSKFSILYENSDNMDYDGDEIHENYNVWIQKLADQIQKDIEFRLP